MLNGALLLLIPTTVFVGIVALAASLLTPTPDELDRLDASGPATSIGHDPDEDPGSSIGADDDEDPGSTEFEGRTSQWPAA